MDNDEDSLGSVPEPDNILDILEPKSHLAEQAGKMNGNAHAESKHEDSTSADGDENESAEVTQKTTFEEEEQLNLTPELQEGLKILNHFLADKKLTEPFIEEVFNQLSESDCEKYKKEISEPMCLSRMKEKFQTGEYDSITQVVSDFQLMIYNCQRFNGINHPVSKKAAKMGVILKQKLNLLRSDIRSKIAQDSSMPWLGKQENQDSCFGTGLRKRTANHRLDDTSAMLNHLRMEEEQKAKEVRKQRKEEHRAAQAAADRELVDWEEDNVTVEPIKSIIRHSWELPQIGLFLFLCRDALLMEEVPMYELERCLAMPRQSKRLHQIMTALLSTPYQREKRAEKSMPDMPYSVWTRKLAVTMDSWYKVLDSCHGDKFTAACKLGLVEKSFEVLGVKNPLQEKLFHNLSFYKKVWILKSLCDYLVEKEENLRTAIESQDPLDQRGLLLGTDRHGNQYIHFTQFCGPNLRIYRQRKPPVPVVKEEEEEEEEERTLKTAKGKSGAKRKLNLDGSSAKRSRSATPLNDSETDGTVSPAPSDTRTKSRASSSRHSSPMPREANGRSRQTSARNSPAPDFDSFALTIPPGKGRKTRNSAESIFFGNMDLESLFRQRSRRNRGAKNAAKEHADAESISTLGDESSQDGLRADTPSSTSALDGDVKTDLEMVNGKLSTDVEECAWTQCEVKSESHDSSDVDIVGKGGRSTHSREHSLKENRTGALGRIHIKSEPTSVKCEHDSEAHDDGAECSKAIESCDIKRETGIKEERACPASVSVDNTKGSNQKSSMTCDNSSRNAAPGNPASRQLSALVSPYPPSSTTAKVGHPGSLKREGSADDSGFASFQTSRVAGAGCREDVDKHIPGAGENGSGVSADRVDLNSTDNTKPSPVDKVKGDEDKGEDTGSIKVEESHAQNDDSVCSSQCGDSFSSKPDLDSGPQTVSNALLDHADYSEEEMMPDPGEFELIVEDMDGLDRLVKQFDPEQVDSSPQISPGARAGKRQKSKITPKAVKHWVCERELHKRLAAMQAELQQFRSKLAGLTKKYRLKLQKEFLNFVEENLKNIPPQTEDLQDWESESDSEQNSDESGVEGSQSGKDSDDSESVTNETLSAASKLKAPSKASSAGSVESLEVDQRDIEEYEADVSSRGRLRKRRLIPNNVEDQGVKKKKVVKKSEDTTPVTPASQVPGSASRSEDVTIKLNISNSEFLAMVKQGGAAATELVQHLAAAKSPSGQTLGWKPQGIKVIGGPIPHGSGEGAGIQRAGATQSAAHPVMQRILSAQGPGNLRPVTSFTVQRKKPDSTPTPCTSVSAQSAAVTVAVVTCSSGSIPRAAESGSLAGLNLQSPLLMAASMKGGKQQVFVVTPEQQQELLRSGILRCQEPRQTMQAASSILRPQVVTSSVSAGVIPAVASMSHTATGARHGSAGQQVSQPQGQALVVQSPSPPSIPAATPRPALSPTQGQGQGVGSLAPGAAPKVQGGMGAVTAVKIVPSSNGQEMVGVPVVVGQVLPHRGPGLKAPVIVNNSSGSRTLILQSGRMLPRYAGNVTVKELLESRAAGKTEEPEGSTALDSGQSKSSSTSPHGRIVTTSASVPVTSPLTITTTRMQRTAPATSLVQRLVSGVVRLPSQSALDDALQTVVTSYHTTLPTADIKVPSPTTLPSLSPRKNITRIVQSTKAPIPTTTRVQAKHSSVVLASTLVSGSSALAAGNRVVSGVVPAGAVVRPGTVVLPAGQALAGVDVSGKEKLVMQVIPHGGAGAGAVPQRYVLPQSGSFLQLASTKTGTTGSAVQESSVLPRLHSQAQSPVPTSSTPPVNTVPSAGVYQPSGQSLLMTLPSSASAHDPTTGGSLLSAAVTKTTSEVLKSMLAAKAVGLTNTVPTTCSSVTAVLHTPVTSSAGMAQISSPSGSFLSQHAIAPLTQMPRVIRAPVAAVGPSVSCAQPAAVVHQGSPRIMQTAAPVALQLQNLAVAGLPVSVKGGTGPAESQRMGVPSMVRMSLPAGVQLAGMQPGGATIRLVAGSQAGSGPAGSLQPVLATLKPGTQGLQQLQLLATAGGLQGIPLSGQTTQPFTFKAGTGAGQGVGGQTVSTVGPSEEQKPTVQLRFTMQPGGQGVMNSTASSVVPQTVMQGAGLQVGATAVKAGSPALASPPLSVCNAGTVSKVIMANPATSLPIPASLPPSSAGSFVSQLPVTTQSCVENRLIMSITPGTESQFIVSPVSSRTASNTSQPLLRQQSVPSQTCTDSSDGQILSTQPPSQLLGTVKRSLSSDLQPIPAKRACVDTGGSNSGAVLAGLSQMVGSAKATCLSGGDVASSTSVRDPTNGSLQRVVMASSAGDNSASCTLLNLAAHVSPGSAASPAVSSAGPAVPQAAISMPLLQQLSGMAPLVGRPQQAGPQKQLLALRSIGGQLLTDNNIPVTENNGEYKVLPKATLQLGSQTVTVLSPSSAMIQNVRNPASANIIPAVTSCQTPTSTAPATMPALSTSTARVVEGAAPGVPGQNQGIVRTILRPDMKPEMVLSTMYPQVHIKPSAVGVQGDRTDVHAVCQDSVGTGTLPAAQEAAGVKQGAGLSSTPLLKARLEQPRFCQSAGLPAMSAPRETLTSVANSQQQAGEGGVALPAEYASVQDSSQAAGGLAAQGCVSGDSKKNVEEEAALNLLTLANQRVL